MEINQLYEELGRGLVSINDHGVLEEKMKERHRQEKQDLVCKRSQMDTRIAILHEAIKLAHSGIDPLQAKLMATDDFENRPDRLENNQLVVPNSIFKQQAIDSLKQRYGLLDAASKSGRNFI